MDKTREAYKFWHIHSNHFPRFPRYSLGIKIDQNFTDLLEGLLLAGYAPKEQKLGLAAKASVKLDALKFFLQIAWELAYLDNKQYAALSNPLAEVGKMLGGWLKQLQTK